MLMIGMVWVGCLMLLIRVIVTCLCRLLRMWLWNLVLCLIVILTVLCRKVLVGIRRCRRMVCVVVWWRFILCWCVIGVIRLRLCGCRCVVRRLMVVVLLVLSMCVVAVRIVLKWCVRRLLLVGCRICCSRRRLWVLGWLIIRVDMVLLRTLIRLVLV